MSKDGLQFKLSLLLSFTSAVQKVECPTYTNTQETATTFCKNLQ